MSERKDRQGHRWFAALYDRQMSAAERRVFSKLRPRIAGETSGRVLEIGAGTGASFPYYPTMVQVVATDPDAYMLEHAEKRREQLKLSNIELREAPAEQLPFEDASFDHVVCGLVLCSVRDQARALAEAKRVLKPGGTFRFIEHVRSDGVAGTLQDVITPVWRWAFAGCHPNRRTSQAIENAGLPVEQLERVKIMRVWPIIAGVSRRSDGP